MDFQNRDRIRDPREEILLETNFDDDGVMTRGYTNSKLRRSQFRSDFSIDRFSEASLHGNSHKGRFDFFFYFFTLKP